MKKKPGFTLIELIMTIVVVGIISIPASLILAQYINSYTFNEDLSYGVQLARMELEKLYNTDFDNITSVTIPDYENSSYSLERQVIYKEGDAFASESLKEIAVRVYYKDKSLTEFTVYRVKNVQF